MSFTCPFPTDDEISNANDGKDNVIVFRDACRAPIQLLLMPAYIVAGLFVLALVIPFIGLAITARKRGSTIAKERAIVKAKLSKSMGKLKSNNEYPKRNIILKFGLFLLAMLNLFNDFEVYKEMIRLVSTQKFSDRCSAVNNKEVFMPYLTNIYEYRLVWPDNRLDLKNYKFYSYNWNNFTDYMRAGEADGMFKRAVFKDNVESFKSLCVGLIEVGGQQECSYADTQDLYECVRVRNVVQENSNAFLKYIIASIVVVGAKELVRLMYVIFILIYAPKRTLRTSEVMFVERCPIVFLLFVRRGEFKKEYFFNNKSTSDFILPFVYEGILEAFNQLALVIYYSLRISGKGIDGSIMFSISMNVLKTLMMIKNVFTSLIQNSGDAKIDVEEEVVEPDHLVEEGATAKPEK